MTTKTKNKKLISIPSLLIGAAFSIDVLRFAYKFLNAPFSTSSLFATSVTTLAVDNFISSGMLLAVMMCFFFLALYALTKKKKLNYLTMCVFVLLFFGIFWTLLALQKSSIVVSVTSPVSPFIMIMAVLVFIGYDEEMWDGVKKAVFYSSIPYTLMSLYETVRFLIKFGFGARLMASGALYGAIVAVFFLYFTLLFNEELVKKHKFILPIQIFILISIMVILQSRSWALHALLLMVIFVYKLSKNYKNRFVFLIIVGIVALAVFVFASDYISTISQGLLDRMEQDSRSGQLKAFFSQVSFKDLMLGGGMKVGYSCFGDPNYQFLDNLVLLTMFKYGIIPTLAYLLLLLSPIFYGLFHKNSEARKGILFFAVWFVVMLGVAIFVSYANNIYNYVFYIAMGRFVFIREKEREKRLDKQIIKKL